jgi:cytochrome c oxidase subunit 2
MFFFSYYKTFLMVLCDYAYPWQILFHDPASPVMEGIVVLHHDLFFVMTIVGIIVGWLLIRTTFAFHHTKNPIASQITHGTTIEIVWTITPSLILMVIAIPSFALLYSIDEVVDAVREEISELTLLDQEQKRLISRIEAMRRDKEQ